LISDLIDVFLILSRLAVRILFTADLWCGIQTS